MSTDQILPFSATPAEAGRLSGLTKTAIYNLLNAGVLEAHQSGRRTLVLMDGVVRHVQSLPKKFGVGRKVGSR